MRLRPGWVAKGGAEGLICAATPEGAGIALKAEDGAMRALRPALARSSVSTAASESRRS
jgi:L-asparaginase II